jgi:protein-S-isoprenylcysteine O-methyltransferase Ste14
MVSRKGKKFLMSFVGEYFMKCYYRMIFTVVSAFLMFGVYYLISSLPNSTLYTVSSWLRWPMHAIQISGMIFGMGSLLVLDAGEFFGIKQMRRCQKSKNPDLSSLSIDGLSPFKLATTGVYSIIRHPIYFAGICMITFQPTITYNWFTVMIVADFYFIYAAFKEERILLRVIHDDYSAYQQKVPMFNIFKGLYNKISTRKLDVSERTIS